MIRGSRRGASELSPGRQRPAARPLRPAKRGIARMSFRSVVGALLVLVGLYVPGAAAQEARGTIQGRVVDASGGAIPGATVEVLNLATGVVTPTTTNEEGSYRVPFLIPGN